MRYAIKALKKTSKFLRPPQALSSSVVSGFLKPHVALLSLTSISFCSSHLRPISYSCALNYRSPKHRYLKKWIYHHSSVRLDTFLPIVSRQLNAMHLNLHLIGSTALSKTPKSQHRNLEKKGHIWPTYSPYDLFEGSLLKAFYRPLKGLSEAF